MTRRCAVLSVLFATVIIQWASADGLLVTQPQADYSSGETRLLSMVR